MLNYQDALTRYKVEKTWALLTPKAQKKGSAGSDIWVVS